MKTSLIAVTAATTLIGLAMLPMAEAGEIKDREQRQEQRIDQGIASGELTGREAARLDAEQAGIEAHRQQAWSDGTLTKRERARLHREQDRASYHIFRQKHDAQVRPGTKKK